MKELLFAKITGAYGKSYTVMIENILYNELGELFIIYSDSNMTGSYEVIPINKVYITKICFYTKCAVIRHHF